MEKVRIWGGRAGQIWPRLLPEIGGKHAAGIPVVMLVPEQYTLQAERELVRGLNLPGLMDIDVLSPRRLMRQVRERGGHDPAAPLDDRGRNMAISQALNECAEALTYYRRVASSAGLADRISSLLSDMQRAGLSPQELAEHAAALPGGAMQAKEQDIARVWQAYEELIAGRFADESAQQQDLLRRLPRSGVLTGAAVYVYGFDVLPQAMCAMLAEAALTADSVTVTLTMDAKEAADGRIFLTQRRSAQEMIFRLNERNVPWEMRYLPWMNDGRAPALQHIEQHLFTRQAVPFDGDAAGVSVHASANPNAEAAYAAQMLHRWHEQGIPWGRMTVALADPQNLAGLLEVTLQAAGIPHYIARKDSALRHGLCRMLLGALRAVGGGFAQQDVLDMARSGFSPLTVEEACLLENYALENGITRGKWLKPFVRGDVDAVEPLRRRLMEPVEALRAELRQASTAEASLTAVFRLLEATHAYDRLLEREEALLKRGLQAEAAQNRQVWQIVMGLLDQLHALLGDRRANMKELARLVESGLTSSAISSLPPRPDSVMVGEAGHMMTGEVDALLLMGMQDGVMAVGQGSLLSENERMTLADGVHRMVGLTQTEQAALRQWDFYRTLALPNRLLTVTFSQGGVDGQALRPAGLIDDLKLLFPQLKISGGVSEDGLSDLPLAPLPALEGLALRLRAMADGRIESLDEAWQEALRWLWRSEEWGGRTRQVVQNLTARIEAPPLPRETTGKLFAQDAVSISRLESFAACPYRHFVDYGLKPVVRRPFAFEADERGSFFHAAMQGYAALAAQHPSWPEVEESAVDEMIDQVLAPLTEAWADGPLREDAMGRQLGDSYVRAVRRAAWLFTQHARNSRFTTWGAEITFGQEGGLPPVVLELNDGRRIALRGTIDRIDRYEGDAGLYLRVVDYKSSQHALDPVRMWYGLQLQLMLYLNAAVQGVQGSLPAGAFYFTVKDPMVDAPEDIKAVAEQKIAQQLRLKGVVLADAEVVAAMDEQEQLSLDKVFNQDGSVSKTASALNLEEMNLLMAHTRKVAAELADRIRDGEIAIAPAAHSTWSACDYCDYAAVCRRDSSLPGGEKCEIFPIDRQEFIERLSNDTAR